MVTALAESAFCRKAVDEEERYAVELLLDEMGSNLVKYGSRKAEGQARFVVDARGQDILVVLVDNHAPFDPLQEWLHPLQQGEIVRPEIGGRGIEMVCRSFERITYEARETENQLTGVLGRGGKTETEEGSGSSA